MASYCFQKKFSVFFLLISLLFCLAIMARQDQHAKKKLTAPFRIEGIAQNNGGGWPFWKAGFFHIIVNRLSTRNDVLALRDVVAAEGQKGLSKALKKLTPAGHIGTTHFAIVRCLQTADGGKMLLLISPEKMCRASINEKVHILGAVQINLDAENKGEGAVAGSVKVNISPAGDLKIEAVGAPSLLLKDVTVKPLKKK